MGAELNRTFNKVQKVNPWGLLSVVLLIVLFCMLGYYGYLTLQVKRLNNVLTEKQQQIAQQNNELATLQQDSSYIRFQAAQMVTTQFYDVNWKERYEYLISVLNILRQLDDTTGQTITFSNINVLDDRITLRGEVTEMANIYTQGGLIDRVTELSFIDYITIPYYRKSGDFFEFVLDATIKTYDTIGTKI